MLHVLPHPRGGGETYVDLLDNMPGYRFARVYLAPSAEPSARELASGVARAHMEGRQHDLVHVHGDATAILCLGLLGLRPSVVTFHGLHLSRRLRGVAFRAATVSLKGVVRVAGRTVCVCRAERDYLSQIIGLRRASRAVVIHNGVRPPQTLGKSWRSDVRTTLGIDDYACVGIWVGSLDERKNPLLAIRAAREAGMTLIIAGDGPLRDEVESVDWEDLHVLGHRDDVDRLLDASDVFILTSDREGLAFSLLEAMSHGLAPVVTAVPENLEAIGDAGVGVPPDHQPALVRALGELAASEDRRRALGARARTRVADLFGVDGMVERTFACYESVLSRAR